MTDAEIRQQRNELAKLEQNLKAAHNQINDIARIEADVAWLRQPIPYTNPELSATKERLISLADGIICLMETLQRRLLTA